MAVDPNTLLPGSLADATEVQVKFDPLYNNITDINIASNAAIQVSKLESMSTGEIIVGTAGGTPTIVTMSGGATVSDTGVISLTGTFPSGSLKLFDTANNNYYNFTAGGDLAADRNVILPLLTANDTFVFANFAQTLANKTLTLPTISDFTNANHDHGSLGGGGALQNIQINGVIYSGGAVKDEDNMASDSNQAICTQQSIKAYVDSFQPSGALIRAAGYVNGGSATPSTTNCFGVSGIVRNNFAPDYTFTITFSSSLPSATKMAVSVTPTDMTVNFDDARSGICITEGSSSITVAVRDDATGNLEPVNFFFSVIA